MDNEHPRERGCFLFGLKEEAVKGRGIEILQQRASLYKKTQRPSF